MTETQQQILVRIKEDGPLGVRDLANNLNLTTMGVRQHLQALQADGLVKQTEEIRQGRGRPLRQWKLTAAGHREFTDTHAEMTVELIKTIRETLGEAALEKVIERRTATSLLHYQEQMQGLSDLESMLDKLASIRSQEGYMAHWRPLDDGSYLLTENHCPICTAASSCQGFCQSELEVFQLALADFATLQRQEHILDGGLRCSYKITPLSESS